MWHGVLPAVTTKFTKDDRLDHAEMERCFALQMEAGCHGLIACGTLGEGNMLSPDERLEVLKLCKQATGSKPALLTISEPGTREACALAGRAAAAGADGLMIVPSPLYHTGPDEAVANLKAIAATGDLPVMIYSNRVGYRVDITPEMMVELADDDRFVAIKESSDDIRRTTEIFNLLGDRYDVLTGVDNLAFEALTVGAVGWVAGLVVAFPKETVAIYELVRQGRHAEALAIHRWFRPLLDLDVSTWLVQQIKLAEVIEIGSNDRVRMPRQPLSGAHRDRVEKVVRDAIASRPTLPQFQDAAGPPGRSFTAFAICTLLFGAVAVRNGILRIGTQERVDADSRNRTGSTVTALGEARPDVIVVGAGIIGLSTAFCLQARGQRVLVIDRKGPAAGASAGNAGAFAFSDIIPLASPGIVRNAPRWLFDPTGPLSIPPAYALKILPWLFRFRRASGSSEFARGIVAQSALMQHSKKALLTFLNDTGLGQMLRRQGNLHLFESGQEFEASRSQWEARRKQLIPFEIVDGPEAIAEIQQGLSSQFTKAVYTPEWYSIGDPLHYTDAVAEKFLDRGGAIGVADAVSIACTNDTAHIACSDGRTLAAGKVVICSGAWSKPLARSLGDRIPLETERGYNTTLPEDAFDLKTQLTFSTHGFVVTKLASGVRVGGAVELGGLSLPANMQRADAMLAKAKRFIPDLDTESGQQWMGFRPSLPDSLPVIGMARGTDRVIYGFGHGHLGLTQSAGTAQLITELALGEPPSIDLTPFRPDRF